MDTLEMFDKLGDYTVLEQIGRGGMGVVYEARHDELGEVAVKLMPGRSRGARSRLLREASVATSLDHPHIVKVYGMGEHDSRPYIVMELVDGVTLKQLIGDRELALERRLDLIKQVLHALTYAHDAGVAHRDIKPQNILVARDGNVRVVDFGLARAGDSSTRTRRGLIGTSAYMPPEHATGREADHRGDIFSVGTVLYELLSGERAFGGGAVDDIVRRLKSQDPPAVHRHDDRLPEELSAITRKAMAKDPDRRYQSAREMLADLEAFDGRLAELRDAAGAELAAMLAPLGPIPAEDPGPEELKLPAESPTEYFEILAWQREIEEQREPFDRLVGELTWAAEMLTTPLEGLDDDTLRRMANRVDDIRDAWPGAPPAGELGHRLLRELKRRLPRRQAVAWGNAGRRPREEVR